MLPRPSQHGASDHEHAVRAVRHKLEPVKPSETRCKVSTTGIIVRWKGIQLGLRVGRSRVPSKLDEQVAQLTPSTLSLIFLPSLVEEDKVPFVFTNGSGWVVWPHGVMVSTLDSESNE